jgi:hypothetical protein
MKRFYPILCCSLVVIAIAFALIPGGCSHNKDKGTTPSFSGPQPDTLMVLGDNTTIGFIGAFTGTGDTLTLRRDSTRACEGIWSLQADFSVRSNGWAGWYIEEQGEGGSETRDLSLHKENGHLRFCIKTTNDIQIGIRSDNIYGGDERSKVYISSYTVLGDTLWHDISIPLIDFANLEPNLDFSKMEVYLVASAVGLHIGRSRGSYWIDNVRWTKD